jgi:predicted HicB family RNase H-like nuclease
MQKLPKSRKRHSLTLTLPPALILRLKAEARATQKSVSQWAEKYFDQERPTDAGAG